MWCKLPAMEKIYYLDRNIYYSLLSSWSIWNVEGLFDSKSLAFCNGVIKELFTVFGNSEEEEFLCNDQSRWICVIFHIIYFLILQDYSSFSVLILMMTMVQSHLDKPFNMHHAWMKRKSWFENASSLTGWVMLVLPEVCVHGESELTKECCPMIERGWNCCTILLAQLTKIQVMTWPILLISFGRNFCIGRIWLVPMFYIKEIFITDALEGRSHIWHEMYSFAYTKVLGFAVCRDWESGQKIIHGVM